MHFISANKIQMKEGSCFIIANDSKMTAMEIRCHNRQDRFLSAVLKFVSVASYNLAECRTIHML